MLSSSIFSARVTRFFSAVAFAALAACSKTEQPGGAPSAEPQDKASAPASASAATTAAASDTAAASASAAPSASAAASASATPSASTTTTSAAASASSGGAATCGTKPLPDCPLQAWMKKNMNPPMAAGDGAGLATALEQSASYAPPGYTNWASIAKDGAKAAKAGDMTAAKASCRTCHDQYKKKYQAGDRARKI